MDIFTSLFTSKKLFGKRDISPPNSPPPNQKRKQLLHETNLSEVDLIYKPLQSPREKNKTNKKNNKN